MAVNSVLRGCDHTFVYLYLLPGISIAEWTGRRKKGLTKGPSFNGAIREQWGHVSTDPQRPSGPSLKTVTESLLT